MQAFPKRSAWSREMRKASWLWPTRTWSAALTVPSRSCRLPLLVLCSAPFGPRSGTSQDLEHCIALQRRTRLMDNISTGIRASEPQSHTLIPVQKGFSNVFFFFLSFPETCRQIWRKKRKTKKNRKRTNMEAVMYDLFFKLWEQNEKRKLRFWRFSCFYCLFLQLGYFFFSGCTKILIFCSFFLVWMAYRVHRELKSHTD